ncbi:hypothetical protein HCA93_09930 [Listeria innocua]|uniref:hypothetical protein n=1 Tax=Listeria innocua TaxID=1642 RepID=UPI001627FBF1|nr:hypothetical protein [Listeria innocua]MBC1904024.1 hypothetical protein [Listeria innocua]MBC2136619.1 hypothetical protein [Listeria innocua]
MDNLAGFNPLFSSIKLNQHISGVYEPDSKLYVRVNDKRRKTIYTDFSGYFQFIIENLSYNDILYFETKIDNKYVIFHEEKVIE